VLDFALERPPERFPPKLAPAKGAETEVPPS